MELKNISGGSPTSITNRVNTLLSVVDMTLNFTVDSPSTLNLRLAERINGPIMFVLGVRRL